MRNFRCYDCGHQFQVPHGVGGRGAQIACPNCGGLNVHRAETDRRFASAGRGRPGLRRGPRWI